jgi:hypothetical protein
MKKTAFLLLFLVLLASCGYSPEVIPSQTAPANTVTSTASRTSTSQPTLTPTPTQTLTPAPTPTATPIPIVIDAFDDGRICSIWSYNPTDNSKIYEVDGLLNIDIGPGSSNNSNQWAGIVSKDYILHDDFIINIDFYLNKDYHSTNEANTKLFLVDKDGNALEISIRTGQYLTIEVPVDAEGIIHNSAPTNDLSGKLRIERRGTRVLTSYWKNEWINFGNWEPEYVKGDLSIDIDSWNMPPNYLPFSVKFDNLQSDQDLGTNCK